MFCYTRTIKHQGVIELKKVKTIYETIGGEQTVNRIIDSLYKHIGKNEILLPIFPEDLKESARKQRLFLTQFLGGEPLYLKEIGRPMLPARHAKFEITPSRRDAWLQCMRQALIEAEIKEPHFSEIMDRLIIPAYRIVNREEPINENN